LSDNAALNLDKESPPSMLC